MTGLGTWNWLHGSYQTVGVYHTATPLILVSHLELKPPQNGNVAIPWATFPAFSLLAVPKIPLTAMPQALSWNHAEGSRMSENPQFSKGFYSNPKDLPHSGANNTYRRLFINSHPAMRDCIPPAGHRDFEKNLHEVCERVNQEFFTPKIPRCPVRNECWRRSNFPWFLTFLCSQCSHLLANGLKACSPLGPRLQCLTSFWSLMVGVSGGFKNHGSIWIL